MYNIIGISRFGEEIIDTADSYSEAMKLVGEYQIAFGNDFIIKCKRK